MNLLIDDKPKACLLVLSDGSVFKGRSCGAEGEVFAPIHVDANIFGYQKSVCAPENAGACVAFTYPQIGNYGVPKADAASLPCAAAIVVHDMVFTPSNWQCELSFPDYLKKAGVLAIEDIDVRALVAKLRDTQLLCAISMLDTNEESLAGRLEQKLKAGELNA